MTQPAHFNDASYPINDETGLEALIGSGLVKIIVRAEALQVDVPNPSSVTSHAGEVVSVEYTAGREGDKTARVWFKDRVEPALIRFTSNGVNRFEVSYRDSRPRPEL